VTHGDMMNCPACQKPITKEMYFCVHCGHKLRHPVPSWIWIAGTLMALGVMFGLVLVSGNQRAGQVRSVTSSPVAVVQQPSDRSPSPSISAKPTARPPTPQPTKAPTARPPAKQPTSTPTRQLVRRSPTPRPPTSTPTPANITCSTKMARDGIFYALWSRHKAELGCPQQERQLGADRIYFVEQPFDKGHMFFFSSAPLYLVIVKYGIAGAGETGKGTWQQFKSEPWSGKDENFCFEGQGLPYPVYDNFNRVWCQDSTVRSGLGNPRGVDSRVWARETGADNSQHVLAQGFDDGFILRDSDGAAHRLAYVFFWNGTYIREQY
jgi:hypothetical protein